MVKIMVSGTSIRRTLPELGVATITVAATGDRRADVLAEAQASHDRVSAASTAYLKAGTATKYECPSVTAWAYKEWEPVPESEGGQAGQHRPVTKYRAGVDISVTFTDFEALGRFLAEVGSDELVNIGSIEWQLTPETERKIERELRTEAARDTVTRAADYADAMGLGTPALAEISEGDLAPIGAPMPLARQMKAEYAMHDGVGGGGGFEMRPREIQLEGTVSASFEAPAK